MFWLYTYVKRSRLKGSLLNFYYFIDGDILIRFNNYWFGLLYWGLLDCKFFLLVLQLLSLSFLLLLFFLFQSFSFLDFLFLLLCQSIMHSFHQTSQKFCNLFFNSKFCLSLGNNIFLELLYIGRYYLNLPIFKKTNHLDIFFEVLSFSFAINIEIIKIGNNVLKNIEYFIGLQQQCKEYSYFLILHFIDFVYDITHFIHCFVFLLELVPIRVLITIFKAILLLHSLFQNVDKFLEEKSKFLMHGLFTKGKLVDIWLSCFLVFVLQFYVEIQFSFIRFTHLQFILQLQKHQKQVQNQSESDIAGKNINNKKWVDNRAIKSLNYSFIIKQFELYNKMSNFRIQRKLTEGSSIKLKPTLSNPQRIRSLQTKQSFSRSPKKLQHNQLRRMIRKVTFKDHTSQKQEWKQKMQQGMKYFREKNINKALEIFKQIRKNGDKSAELSYYLGSCFLNLGKNQSSIVYLNECLLQNQRYSQNAYLYIAINFKLIGNLRQAVKTLEKGTGVFPAFEQGFFYKGKLYMKMSELTEAIQAFTKCLQLNPFNDLATIFLGDCLKALGKYDKALQKYKNVMHKGTKHREIGVGRVANTQLERKNEKELLKDLKELIQKGFEHPQVNYYMGVCFWNIGQKHNAVVYFQTCLSNSKEPNAAIKSLKALIRISVQEGNFFQAEHHISRIQKLGLSSECFKQWKLFVEGTNDLIKRKNEAALQKIMKSLQLYEQKEGKQKVSSLEFSSFGRNVYPYAAYAQYLNNNIEECIKMYGKAVQGSQDKLRIKYAKLMAEGIYAHGLLKFQESFAKFQQAYYLQNTPESLFLSCITLVQFFKTTQKNKDTIFQKIQKLLQCQKSLESKSALFLFYCSLVLMFQNKPCLSMIQQAIKACEQPISEYYFIEALSLHSESRLTDAIQSISRAIELDPGIEQFYRQRSKYYFLAQDYQSAIEDCLRAESMVPDDEELPLLLSFFYYLNDQFVKSYNYLLRTKPSSGKLREFQQALQLRLGMFDRLQEIGKLLMAIKEQKQITQRLMLPLQTYIAQRHQYSQFSVYFYHLILAIGYAKMNEHQKSLNHLFGCLQEIQFLVDQRESKQTSHQVTWEQTQEMLDQIKFNIVIVSLMKQNYEETQHFIQVFLTETESQQLKDSFHKILQLIKNDGLQGEIRLMAQDDFPRISDRFPTSTIRLKKQTIVTKLLMSYPVKLKFTICPEFDPAYLLNFDIDKIQYKIPPPWLKSSTKRVNFTNSIRNQSVLLTESQASERRNSKKSVLTIKQKLKLDKQVEKRLKKIIQRQ